MLAALIVGGGLVVGVAAGIAGAGVGIGYIFGKMIEAVARHAADAVRAGLAIQQAMQRLNGRWRTQGWETHLVRAGLTTGYVTVGNFGTDALWQYGVVGSEVNKGKRLEGAAPPGGLALAPRTYALARAQGALMVDLPPTRVRFKGFEEEADLYLVMPDMVMK